jgi:hypothetical protein
MHNQVQVTGELAVQSQRHVAECVEDLNAYGIFRPPILEEKMNLKIGTTVIQS